MHERVKGNVSQLVELLQGRRQTVAVLLYGAATAAAYATAYQLRFEFSVPPEYVSLFLWTVGPLVAIRLLAFRAFRLTRERWRYTSTRDAMRLAAGAVVGSAVFFVLFDMILPGVPRVPLSILAIEAVLTCCLTAGMWVTYRATFEHVRRSADADEIRRVLIIGAGDAGNLLAREMLRQPGTLRPVAFVDDEPRMWGALVQGVEVSGPTADLDAIAADCRVDEIVIAVPSAEPEELRRIVAACEATGLPFKVLPGMREVLAGNVGLHQLREVRIEDLLGREPIELELPELAEDLAGTTVLVTGAAGSIGSELCRQIALHHPRQLVLFDQAETEMFFLELDLRAKHPELEIVPVIGDIADAPGVERVFRLYEPDRVFHAAAYKHVPMMECNAREAIRNNVIGTWRVAEAAGRFGTGKFVLVSTDKAVRPSNVMGATKRLAELIILELQQRFDGTTYGAVRFGNVLGSNGSVIPVFRSQLAEGKPLTVTHPDATRFFMTIPEAVQLILQASLLDQFRGHIAMLDMGEPVRITDLALNLLRLSGLPNEGRVVFTGLRPGEKMHEELSAPDELAIETVIPKVRILRTPPMSAFALSAQVNAWDEALGRQNDDFTLLAGFYELFPALHREPLGTKPPAVIEVRRPRVAGAGG